MKNREKKPEQTVGELRKKREPMPDGKRYIIYYTFGSEQPKTQAAEEEQENV